MRIAANLPRFLWPEAVNHAYWVRNRMPTRALPSFITPHEIDGKFGSLVKMDHFIGVDDESKGIRVWYPGTRRIIVECDFYWSQDANETVPIEGETTNKNANVKTNQHDASTSDMTNTHPAAPNTAIPNSPDNSSSHDVPSPPAQVTPGISATPEITITDPSVVEPSTGRSHHPRKPSGFYK
ncbi:hypothetical protein FISHEDRAFT_46200, partial [Fistulina hepatica ATCC 64428]